MNGMITRADHSVFSVNETVRTKTKVVKSVIHISHCTFVVGASIKNILTEESIVSSITHLWVFYSTTKNNLQWFANEM